MFHLCWVAGSHSPIGNISGISQGLSSLALEVAHFKALNGQSSLKHNFILSFNFKLLVLFLGFGPTKKSVNQQEKMSVLFFHYYSVLFIYSSCPFYMLPAPPVLGQEDEMYLTGGYKIWCLLCGRSLKVDYSFWETFVGSLEIPVGISGYILVLSIGNPFSSWALKTLQVVPA